MLELLTPFNGMLTEALITPTSSSNLMFAPHVRTLASSTTSSSFRKTSSLSFSNLRRSFATVMDNNNTNVSTNVEDIFAKKRLLRTEVRKKLKNMSPSQRAEEDETIQNIVSEAPWFQSANGLCAYVTCKALREVDTSKLLSKILSNDANKDSGSKNMKKLYLPRIEDKNSNMKMLHVSSYDALLPNSMNILEPTLQDHNGNEREELLQASEPVDLFLVPGLAFDKSGRRLGRSGGYYDFYLKRYLELAEKKNWKPPLIVALSYSIQIMEDGAIGVTSNDVPVDALVSPAGVIYTNAGKNP